MGKSLSDIYKEKYDKDRKDEMWKVTAGIIFFCLCLAVATSTGHEGQSFSGLGFMIILIIPITLFFLGPSLLERLSNREYNFLKSFICPHCLKTLKTKDIRIACPFCDDVIDGDEHSIFLKHVGDECNSKIKHIECYKCKEAINLFAPYDQDKLEAKRYE